MSEDVTDRLKTLEEIEQKMKDLRARAAVDEPKIVAMRARAAEALGHPVESPRGAALRAAQRAASEWWQTMRPTDPGEARRKFIEHYREAST